MHCTRLICLAKKHLNPAILKSNLWKLRYFQISQNCFWIEIDTQKSTKSHVQPCNHCFLKICQPPDNMIQYLPISHKSHLYLNRVNLIQYVFIITHEVSLFGLLTPSWNES